MQDLQELSRLALTGQAVQMSKWSNPAYARKGDSRSGSCEGEERGLIPTCFAHCRPYICPTLTTRTRGVSPFSEKMGRVSKDSDASQAGWGFLELASRCGRSIRDVGTFFTGSEDSPDAIAPTRISLRFTLHPSRIPYQRIPPFLRPISLFNPKFPLLTGCAFPL